jgi:photosystem II stability/assembly factor-like uncharacterized protein
MKRTLVAAASLGLSIGLTLCAVPAHASDKPKTWHTPTCAMVDSDGSLTYTTDRGDTVTPTTGTLNHTEYVFDIVPMATPDSLLAVDNTGRLYRSGDAGCAWTQVNHVTGIYYGRLAASPDGTAYLWSINSDRLVHVSGSRVIELPEVDATASLIDLVVDPRHAAHLRAVTDDGRVLDSADGGRHFAQVGQTAGTGTSWFYSASIDPRHLDHIVLGSQSQGSYVTQDAGRAWQHDGMGEAGDRVNAFSVAVSPASSRVVYAQGLNLREYDARLPSGGRHLYRSTDGGRTFEPVLDQGNGVTLQNGTLLAPSPTDPDTLHFVFSMSYGGYGTDLFSLDTRHGTLSLAHDPHDKLTAIAFNPKHPSVMYLGFGEERVS